MNDLGIEYNAQTKTLTFLENISDNIVNKIFYYPEILDAETIELKWNPASIMFNLLSSLQTSYKRNYKFWPNRLQKLMDPNAPQNVDPDVLDHWSKLAPFMKIPERDYLFENVKNLVFSGSFAKFDDKTMVTDFQTCCRVALPNLEFIDMPNIIEIGQEVFTMCHKLTRVNVPKVARVGYRAFADTNLKEITFENEITYLYNEIFADTPITKITFKGPITRAQWSCLYGAKNLKFLTVLDANSAINLTTGAPSIPLRKEIDYKIEVFLSTLSVKLDDISVLNKLVQKNTKNTMFSYIKFKYISNIKIFED